MLAASCTVASKKKKKFCHDTLWLKLFFYLLLQHSEEIYDPEIYRHQIAEYYNPYVLEADIQAGEFYFDIVIYLMCLNFNHHLFPYLLSYLYYILKCLNN